MNSIELIRENLQRSETIVLSRIEEMRDDCLTPPSPQAGCHTLWILGHLAYIEHLVIDQFMLGRENPLQHWEQVFDGAEVSTDHSLFTPFDQTLAECRAARSSTLALLDSYEESGLDQISVDAPKGTDNLFGTHRRCFQYCADHWFMHRGQLADARCAAGQARMWY